MANGLLGYQQQSQLSQALQARRQRADETFMGAILRDQMEGAGDVYMQDGKPQYEPGLMDFTSKDAALNAYIQHRKGRVSDMEILAFNEQFKQMKGMREAKEMDNLNRLSAMGLSDTKLRNFVSNNPKLYGTVVDRILALESMGDEGMASAALLRSKFLPQKGRIESFGERFEDKPLETSILGIGGIGLATGVAQWVKPKFVNTFGQNPEAIKALKDLSDGNKYIKQGDKWYHTKIDRHKITRGKNKGKVTTKVLKGVAGKPVTLPNVVRYLNAADAATTPTSRMALKNFFGKIPGGVKGTLPYFAPTIGRGIAGEEGELVGQIGGGGYLLPKGFRRLGKALPKFLAKAGARHAAAAGTGVGALPWSQAGMGLLDVGMGAGMLYDAFLGDE
jgi:hypothetical protein